MESRVIKDPDYKVFIDADVLAKFNHILFGKYNKEFTAFTHCDREDNKFYMKDIFFPEQSNTTVKTDVDSDAIVSIMAEGADLERLNGHLHSHVDMKVFASGTDEDEILERAYLSGFNVAVILNKKGDVFVHVADYTNNTYATDVPFEIVYPFTHEEFEAYQLSELKFAETLKDAREILKYDVWDYYYDIYGLSKEDEQVLDEIVKTRFKSLFTPVKGYKSKSFGTAGFITPVKQTKKLSEMTEKEWYEMTEDEYGYHMYNNNID